MSTKSSFDPYVHVGITPNPDGTITRHTKFQLIATNPDAVPGNPIVCKDVTLNPKNDTWARIFRPTKLPSNDNTIARLPIIIYFHGGGFVLYSSADALVHKNCSNLASEIPAIVVSVNYRLGPEHRLPAAYDDAVDAILWVKQQAETNGEPWLYCYGDFSRCYLGGRGSGGNIVYHAALKALDVDLGPVKISGLFMNQPMFGGVQRTKSEIKFATDNLMPLPVQDLMWELALPKGTDRNHRFCNPMLDGPHKSKLGSVGRCLVIGFSGDAMMDRQQEFVKMLALSGVHVQAEFGDVGFHGIDIVDHKRSLAVLKLFKQFII